MRTLGDIGKTIGEKIARATASEIAAGLVGALLIGWAWLWNHMNPRFEYEAQTSTLSSHFIALGQVLSQIEKDSHLYCSGGWDQRIAWVGMRRCHRFSFAPVETYRMTVCTRDERAIKISESDQLAAFRELHRQLDPLQCFEERSVGDRSYVIVPGTNAHFRTLLFPDSSRQSMGFCRCSEDEETEIAKAMGAMME